MSEKETLMMNTKQRKTRRSRGQALVEFSLIAPILMLVILAIFDYGRVLLVYANAATNLRDAARNSQVSGLGGSNYADCALIEAQVNEIWFATIDDVRVLYYDNTNFNGYDNPDFGCNGDGAPMVDADQLENGFIMRVEVDATIEFMTPFMNLINENFSSLEMNFFSQRTVLKQFEIIGDTNDQDADGLDDYWELIWFGCAAPGGGGSLPDAPGTDVPPGTFDGACEVDDEGNPIPWLERYGAFDDPDNDGATNGVEEIRGTNPIGDGSEDTDNDGLTDEEEIFDYNTDPRDPDSDDDGINDYDEVNQQYNCGAGDLPYPDGYTSNPLGTDDNGDDILDGYDTDLDGLNDYEELCLPYITDPGNPDTDGDGIDDFTEQNGYDTSTVVNGALPPHTAFTNPTLVDSDNDGLEDGEEASGSRGSVTYPDDPDTDNDGLEDGYEWNSPYDISPTDADSDNDGLDDQSEVDDDGNNPDVLPGDANPEDPNTDGPENETVLDGRLCNMKDGEERNDWGTNPSHLDTDGDGLSDCMETRAYPTDPLDDDSDNDGFSDGDEVAAYCDPMDPASFPNPSCSEDLDGDGLADDWEVFWFGDIVTWDGTGDPDGDLCNNECEETQTTFPDDPDTDDDGRTDWEELSNEPFSDPTNPDTDGDGLNDGQEIVYNTFPRNPDSDGDRLEDGDEVNIHGTQPRNIDSDNDGITDYQEVNGLIEVSAVEYAHAWGPTNPLSDDTDTDGLEDYEEIVVLLTNPNSADTDGDGLPDNVELNESGTEPNNADTDDDGLTDGQEYYDGVTYMGLQNYEMTFCAGTADETIVTINLITLNPLNPDKDGDGLEDGEEVNIWGTNPVNVDSDGDDQDEDSDLNDFEEVSDGDAATDPMCASSGDANDSDGDGISNTDELAGTYGYVTDPFDEDSDQDGIDDKTEMVDGYDVTIHYVDRNNSSQNISETIHTSPIDNDSDDDGLLDGEERDGTYIYRTHPLIADTDGDSLLDGDEIHLYGTNPLNGFSDWQRQWKAANGIWDSLSLYNNGDVEAAYELLAQKSFTITEDGMIAVRVQATGGNNNAIQTLIVNNGGTLIASPTWGIEAYVDFDLLGILLFDSRVSYIHKL